MREAILDDVKDWKKLDDELEIKKAHKKMRMLFAHFLMYQMKMEEVNSNESGSIDRQVPFQDMNKKKDEDFVYF